MNRVVFKFFHILFTLINLRAIYSFSFLQFMYYLNYAFFLNYVQCSIKVNHYCWHPFEYQSLNENQRRCSLVRRGRSAA
jgi:hypothetical protein